MAFNYIMQMATSCARRLLPESPTVIELGNQRFRYSPEITDACCQATGYTIRHPVEYVWEFFEDLGFADYASIDVNDELKAIPMDLNVNLREVYNFRTEYDLVTNNGTGEHIFDQKLVFENMHNLCKPGGIMICVLPFGPWINHGFFNFNPILWRDLVAANGYEWLFMWIGLSNGEFIETKAEDWAFYEQKKMKNPISRIEEAYYGLSESQNVSLVAAYRRLTASPFSVPMQGRYVNDADQRIRQAYSNPDTRQTDHNYAHIKQS